MNRLAVVLMAVVLSATALAQEPLPVKTMGKGETQMVLVPGLAADWRVWEDFMQRNQDVYTMHAIRAAPGFGDVPPPGTEEGETPLMDSAVAGIAATLEEKGLEDAVIMGHGSLGAFLALRVAIEHPQRVSKVVTVDGMLPSMPLGPSGITSGAQRDAIARQFSALLLEQFPQDQWEAMTSGEEQSLTAEGRAALKEIYEGADFEIGTGYIAEMILVDLAPQLREAEAPVLALYAISAGQSEGDDQPMVLSKRQSQAIMRDSLGASTAVFYHSRPWLMRDRPESFDETIRTFLRGLPVSDVLPGDGEE